MTCSCGRAATASSRSPAARTIRSSSWATPGADLRVHKRIPLGGGLGGGSSDAATTLVALNRLWNLGFTTDELASLGLKLGADVPVFVRGQAAWAEGVGERLRPIAPQEPWYCVITPPVAVSTGAIFAAPELRRDHPPVTPADFEAGTTGNDCEPVTTARHPEVAAALAFARAHGAARMSGTGASVFLPCATREAALACAREAATRWPALAARGTNRSPLLAAAARG
jgi:4-diphosphocytidyl-2-C-methyl-D-erythritol kinase